MVSGILVSGNGQGSVWYHEYRKESLVRIES